MKKPFAPKLDTRFTFERDMAEPDWSGHPGEPDWRPLFTVWGNIAFMRGGEAVIAARLTARQPAILTIRNSAAARGIKPSDRAVNARTGEIFNIREQPRVSKDSRGFLEILVEAGASE
ncbi:head-tail adaptor protein [Chelativorans sp. Marseille-P2723]|uniref:head-tail adaptor protein n=1 Tax=Chelativorans sp. Marseille-P2723 TaxID=2709133 RepID=UPI00157131A4|nr:head-tail adaptor protein [Chelativorans sp. Marseille-P2723]